jgi:hypothetical protein
MTVANEPEVPDHTHKAHAIPTSTKGPSKADKVMADPQRQKARRGRAGVAGSGLGEGVKM